MQRDTREYQRLRLQVIYRHRVKLHKQWRLNRKDRMCVTWVFRLSVHLLQVESSLAPTGPQLILYHEHVEHAQCIPTRRIASQLIYTIVEVDSEFVVV